MFLTGVLLNNVAMLAILNVRKKHSLANSELLASSSYLCFEFHEDFTAF